MTTFAAMEHIKPIDTPATSPDVGGSDADMTSALIAASFHLCQEVIGRRRNIRSDICEVLAASSPPEEAIQNVRRLLLQRRIDSKDPISPPKTEVEKEFIKMMMDHPHQTQIITNELSRHIIEIDALLDAIAHIMRTEDNAASKVAKMTDLLI